MQDSFRSAQENLPALCHAAAAAGDIIMSHFGAAGAATRKADGSPVTAADIAADEYLHHALRALFPDICIVSEERPVPTHFAPDRAFFLLDPLDGTRSFMRGSGAFTVNIGLVVERQAVLGVIYDPVGRVNYWGSAGGGAFRQVGGAAAEAIHTRTPPADDLTAILSHAAVSERMEEFLAQYSPPPPLRGRDGVGGSLHSAQTFHPPPLTLSHAPPSLPLLRKGGGNSIVTHRTHLASSLKFCRVAEGAADLYPRFGETYEWDTAAGQAILEAAGGRMTTMDGAPFRYGKPGFRNGGFLASG